MNRKQCFGNYENSDNSWHCKGCVSAEECRAAKHQVERACMRDRESKKYMNRPDKDTYYLDIALAVSKRSTCLRRRYGAVIVKDDVIVATGYNGSPRGEVNCCDCGICHRADKKQGEGYEQCPAVHAEQNAMLSADISKLKGATLYLACEERTIAGDFESLKLKYGDWNEITMPKPCNICRRMIENVGIQCIVTRGSKEIWG